MSSIYRVYGKRLIDILASTLGLIVLSPVFVLVAVLLALQNRGKVFFFQERPGLGKKTFNIVKFKTMTDSRDREGNLLPDRERLTRFGRAIRALSLDEIPQLFNVLRGDMSLVGPRPLLPRYIPLYSETQTRRHEVRPGITGWAQVNGRNSISWTQKFAYDVYYVDNLSFALDMKILWMTVLKVLRRDGINQSEDRPMEPFNGYN